MKSHMKGASQVAMALAAIAFLAIGCGKQQGDAVASGSGATDATAQTPAVAPQSSQGAIQSAAAPREVEAAPQEETGASASIDTIPPDVLASVPDTPVIRGEIVEITAVGSADVVEINLSDGIGKMQPLVYDSTAGLWRVFYRVPLKTSTERLALSVTAKNGSNRWRRVWVFLKTEREAAQPDSLSGS